MEELRKFIAEKAEVTEEQAEKSYKAMLEFFEDKMPESVLEQFDEVMEGKKFSYGEVFADEWEEIQEDISERFEKLRKEGKVKADEWSEEAMKNFSKAKDEAQEFARRFFPYPRAKKKQEDANKEESEEKSED